MVISLLNRVELFNKLFAYCISKSTDSTNKFVGSAELFTNDI